ncbi:MAG: hypothetical protein NT062_30530 [Proteobacteria bacterium]|nr:hypothetical protein [Pseudomonadota bacterium]
MGSLLTVVATSFGGCIFTSDDTGNASCGDGFIDPGETCDDANNVRGDGCSAVCQTEGAGFNSTSNWNFATIAFNGAGTDTVQTPGACPGGQFTTAAIVSQAVDGTGTPIGTCGPDSPSGTCFVDRYNCADATGTDPLPAGDYLRWIQITNDTGTQTYARTLSAYITVSASTPSFTGTILHDGGYFLASWSLVKTATNAPLTCATGPVDGIALDSTVTGASSAVADSFTCTDGFGTTAGLPDGSYTVSVQAIDAQSAAIGPATVLTNKTIGVQNAITDLGDITIKVD